MHQQTLQNLQHSHDFAVINKKGERRTKQVLVLTLLTMLLEIAAGTVFNSMALLADGWHMATHVAAFLITLFAYRYSRIHADDQTFAFGAGKVGVLGGFASSIALSVVALMMAIEAGERLLTPHNIQFDEATLVACFGLLINVICAVLLRDHHHDHHGHHHGHDHDDHDHHEGHHGHDSNLKAAYLHVLADALTSVLAIGALLAGKYYGLNWLDPVMGFVGAIVISHWGYRLVKETAPILIDESVSLADKKAIIEVFENDADNRVADLHIWRVGPKHFALLAVIVSDHPKSPEHYKRLLNGFGQLAGGDRLAHVTVEVHPCNGNGCQGIVTGE